VEHLFLAVHFGGLAVVVAAELASLTARVRRVTGRTR
jgi:hypothetical protein